MFQDFFFGGGVIWFVCLSVVLRLAREHFAHSDVFIALIALEGLCTAHMTFQLGGI